MPVRVVGTSAPLYPVIEIYEPVYPHFDIYPSWSCIQRHPQHDDDTRPLHHKISPSSIAGIPVVTSLDPAITSKWAYPVIQIYKPVYPYLDIYPSWARVQAVPTVTRVFKIRREHPCVPTVLYTRNIQGIVSSLQHIPPVCPSVSSPR